MRSRRNRDRTYGMFRATSVNKPQTESKGTVAIASTMKKRKLATSSTQPNCIEIKGRKIINIYEYGEGNDFVANRLAMELTNLFDGEVVIGLGQPLEGNAYLLKARDDKDDYSKSVAELYQEASQKNIEVICIDQPYRDSQPKKKLKKNQDEKDDKVSDEFKANQLYSCTRAKNIITISGMARFAGFSRALMALDPSVSLGSIFLNIHEDLAESQVEVCQHTIENKSLNYIVISAPNEQGILNPSILSQVKELLASDLQLSASAEPMHVISDDDEDDDVVMSSSRPSNR